MGSQSKLWRVWPHSAPQGVSTQAGAPHASTERTQALWRRGAAISTVRVFIPSDLPKAKHVSFKSSRHSCGHKPLRKTPECSVKRFSIECLKAKTKVTTTANQKKGSRYSLLPE